MTILDTISEFVAVAIWDRLFPGSGKSSPKATKIFVAVLVILLVAFVGYMILPD